MNYKVKQMWALLIIGLLILGMYLKNVLEAYLANGIQTFDRVNEWAKTMLLYILIGAILTIIVMVIFHVLLAVGVAVKNKKRAGEREFEEADIEQAFDVVEDEMDQLIKLKAGKVSYIIVGTGFVAGLISLVFYLPVGIMLNVVYISFLMGGIVETIIKLYFYQTGVTHG